MNTVIVTDSCADMPAEFYEEYQIKVLPMAYILDEKEYLADAKGFDYKHFYGMMEKGCLPTTSQVTVQDFLNAFEQAAAENKNVLCFTISSALSGTYNSACMAKEQCLEKYPNAVIYVLDTLGASSGQGLLIYHAASMLKEGQDVSAVIDWLEEHKLRLNHWFTVEDLKHMRRTGRLSGGAHFVASVLSIRPVLWVDPLGRLVPVLKVLGRQKALKALIDKMDERGEELKGQVVSICQADCMEDALYLKKLMLERFHVADVIIGGIGPVIGSHVGAKTIGVFFLGKLRSLEEITAH